MSKTPDPNTPVSFEDLQMFFENSIVPRIESDLNESVNELTERTIHPLQKNVVDLGGMQARGVVALSLIFILVTVAILFFHPLKSQLRALDIEAAEAGYKGDFMKKHCASIADREPAFPHLRCQLRTIRAVEPEAITALKGLRIHPLEDDDVLYGNYDSLQELLVDLKREQIGQAEDLTKLIIHSGRMKRLVECATSEEDLYERAGNTPDEQGCYPFTCGIESTVLTEYRRYDGENWQLCE